ncbi:hypothetical protein RN22_15880 [Grimontia sp. AD028]|uniref:hypothetical protein n=1 Tax=Grimontia sp. AD028 TaxID=1581149 RepID=UPI00061B57F7|nr:hypothetical protein [Grimontia sp. AD028]KKD59396.1 hypothetical protein RN22_15880 [Grimontia sp. AD028]
MKELIVVAKYFPPMKNARSIQAKLFIDALTTKYKVTLVTLNSFENYENHNSKLSILRVGKPSQPDSYDVNTLQRVYRKLSKEIKVTFGNDWSNCASKELSKIIEKGATVVSLSEPFDSHLAVLKIRRKLEFNWLCFYSDPWPHSIMPKPYSNSALPLLSRLQEKKSRTVLNSADGVLLTNSRAVNFIEKKLDLKLKYKSEIIRHQMALDIKELKIDKDEANHIVHIGHLSKERVNVDFFYSLVSSLNTLNISKVKIVGRVCDGFIQLIKEKRWSDIFELTGELSHKDALNIARSSRAVLLIEAKMDDSPFVPSKLAEYFNLPVPIICLTNENSESSQLIRSVNNGIVITHDMDRSTMTSKLYEFKDVVINEDAFSNYKQIFSSDNIITSISKLIK